jgi:DnaJ family protein B protein 4
LIVDSIFLSSPILAIVIGSALALSENPVTTTFHKKFGARSVRSQLARRNVNTVIAHKIETRNLAMQDENPFALLGVGIDADDATIRKSYYALAMQWHPDKNPDRRSQAEDMFRRINDAYTILMNPDKKRGAVIRAASPRRTHSGPQSLPRRSGLGSFDPMSDSSSGWSDGPPDSWLKRDRLGSAPLDDKPFDAFFEAKNLDIRIEVFCTLEEMFQCGVKNVQMTRQTEDGTFETKNIRVTLTPGLENLAEIKLPRRGNQEWGRIPGDVILIITEEEHERFARCGDDIHERIVVSLRDALSGRFALESVAVDGEVVAVMVDGVVQPGMEVRVPERGLKRPDGTRGDHVFVVSVFIPTLAPEQLEKVLELL